VAAPAGSEGFVKGALETALIVLAVIGVTAVVAAAIEITFRELRRRRSRGAEAPLLGAFAARRYYQRVLYGIAPAAVASAIALGRSVPASHVVFLFAVMMITATALRAKARPLHLMPIARIGFNAFVPAAGVAVALLPGAFGDPIIGLHTAGAVLMGTIPITVMAGWLDQRFQADRPVWTAVIGSRSFADKLSAVLA
jgi:hypothetical protein